MVSTPCAENACSDNRNVIGFAARLRLRLGDPTGPARGDRGGCCGRYKLAASCLHDASFRLETREDGSSAAPENTRALKDWSANLTSPPDARPLHCPVAVSRRLAGCFFEFGSW